MKHFDGFTLIELMVAVAIIAILAVIAYPSYVDYMKRSKRADGKNALIAVQTAQEKFRANNPSYGATLNAIGVDGTSLEGYYTITLVAANATSYSATAAPRGTQVGDTCGTFAVDQDGPDYDDGYANKDCWQR